MRPDDPRIVNTGYVIPHRWEECRPSGRNPDGTPNAEMESALRKIFHGLPVTERLKFHQFTCRKARTPVHLAVIEKIADQLRASGFAD